MPATAKKQGRMQYVRVALPEDAMPKFPAEANVQVLSIERREGSGQGNFETLWHYVLIWR